MSNTEQNIDLKIRRKKENLTFVSIYTYKYDSNKGVIRKVLGNSFFPFSFKINIIK